MEAIKCNECGEAIGGGGNHLQSNQCADMMEDIATQQDEATAREEGVVFRSWC
jgi:hypothetical protein